MLSGGLKLWKVLEMGLKPVFESIGLVVLILVVLLFSM